MTAQNVYGVKVGDRYRAGDGKVLTIERFLSPVKLNDQWLAEVTINDSNTRAKVAIKDLIAGVEYTKVSE